MAHEELMSNATIASRPPHAKRTPKDRPNPAGKSTPTAPPPSHPRPIDDEAPTTTCSHRRYLERLENVHLRAGLAYYSGSTIGAETPWPALLDAAYSNTDPDMVRGMLATVAEDISILRAAVRAGAHALVDDEIDLALIRLSLRIDVACEIHSRVLRAALDAEVGT
jgi:hypothetical protein